VGKTALAVVAVCVALAAVAALAFWAVQMKQRPGRMAQQVRELYENKEYDEAARLAEEFLKKYPRDPNAATVKSYLEPARAGVKQGNREDELVKAFKEVIEASEKDPQNIQKHLDTLDDIAAQYSDMPGVERRVDIQKQVVKRPWNELWSGRLDAITKAMRDKDFTEAKKLAGELGKLCEGIRAPLKTQCDKNIDEIQAKLKTVALDQWYKLHNEAFSLRSQGKKDEALKLYQSVLTWGEPEAAKLAQECIDDLQGKKIEPESTPAPDKPLE